MPGSTLPRTRRLLAALFVALPATVPVGAFLAPAFARAADPADVEVVALFKDRAVLRTGAGERMLRVGETSPDGVTLLDADARGARVRYSGREQVLALSTRVASAFATPAPARIAISPDAYGQYRARGAINGQSADFLVDTGASVVVLNGQRARALGIAFEQGQRGTIQTAQGTIEAFFLDLDTVAVAGIESRGVQAAVIEGDFPADILLGMSFLREVGLEARDGVMTLTRKH